METKKILRYSLVLLLGAFSTVTMAQASFSAPATNPTVGTNNTNIGTGTGSSANVGNNNYGNTFVGSVVGVNNNGQANSIFGSYAFRNNTTGSFNVGLGQLSLQNNTTGSSNIAIGNSSLPSNTSGGGNIAMGQNALQFNNVGNINIAIGQWALRNNTSGEANLSFGNSAGYSNTSGNQNLFVGQSAGTALASGTTNSFFGFESGKSITAGSYNLFLGNSAGTNLTNGSRNTFIGTFSLPTSAATTLSAGYDTSNTVIIADGEGNQRVYIHSNGNTGIGLGNSVIPQNKLEIKGASSTSGLRFTNLPNTVAAIANPTTKVLSVNASGDVILVNDLQGSGGEISNALTSSVNTMTSIVNGSSSNASIVNSISNTIANGQLTTTVNGVASAPVALPSGGVDTDQQTLTVTGNQLAISNGNTVTLPSLTEVDGDVTNELQNLALTGNVLSISNGNSVTLPSFTDTDTDAQTLSVSGNQLTISNGNTVDLPVADGSETKIQGGTCTTVTGNGTTASPYVINYSCGTNDDINIYEDNGTLTSNRTVDMDGKNLIFKTGGNTTTTGGRIYIGNQTPTFPTTTGDYRLNVEGGILTEKVKVALRSSANWADYVFADNYKLMPLKEVEAFVKENKHLPGVASAENLTKEGLDLGQMQAKQMEKIEELTLYVIDQNKTIEKQSKEIEELKAMVNALLEKK